MSFSILSSAGALEKMMQREKYLFKNRKENKLEYKVQGKGTLEFKIIQVEKVYCLNTQLKSNTGGVSFC